MTTLRTQRLVLRPWTEADRGPYAAMNADPEVMEHFPSVQDRATSDAAFDGMLRHWERHGFGQYAVDDQHGFVGMLGLAVPGFAPPFAHHAEPAVEIGWRLARSAWGQGYATEGARRVRTYAFEELGLPEIVSFTAVGNTRSRAVMERIGMHHDPAGDFDHPRLPEGSPIRRHVLYRLGSEEFARLEA